VKKLNGGTAGLLLLAAAAVAVVMVRQAYGRAPKSSKTVRRPGKSDYAMPADS
jgi:hypothetical protein